MAKNRKKIKTKTPGSTIKLVQLAHARGLPLPAYQSPAAAGFDLVAAVAESAPIKLKPGTHALIPTGLIFKLPEGTEAQVRPRSGLAAKHGVTVLNSPGTIDSDYRGELQVILINHGTEVFLVSRGERIAQCVLASVSRAKFKLKKRVQPTVRGSGGFGSTGVTTISSGTKAAATKTTSAQAAMPVKTMASAAQRASKKSGLAAKGSLARAPRAKGASRKNRTS